MLLVLIDTESINAFEFFLSKMKAFEQRKYINSAITVLAKQYFASAVESKEDAFIKPSLIVSGVATFIHILIKNNELLREHLVSTMTKATIPSLDDSLAARRSVIAAIAQDEG